MTLSDARDVVVEYDGRRVLDGLTLSLEPGGQYAVTGRSGSGKTTLLLVLAGLLTPTTGNHRLGVPARDVAYVPQAPSLVPELSALDNATLGLRLRGVDPTTALEKARGELELLGLGEACAALPDELSTGMQHRVALARATVLEPRLLLSDEPTGALDRRTGEHVLDVLRELSSRRGTALVVATHDPAIAAGFGHRLELRDGRLAA